MFAGSGAAGTDHPLVEHVTRTVATDPDAGWIIVCDQLNIHWSESLVRYVAQQCQLPDDLVKGRLREAIRGPQVRRGPETFREPDR